jgi:hypothetical protein
MAKMSFIGNAGLTSNMATPDRVTGILWQVSMGLIYFGNGPSLALSQFIGVSIHDDWKQLGSSNKFITANYPYQLVPV